MTGYALTPPTQPSLFELAQVGQGMKSVIGDIRDLEKMKLALQAAKPSIVIHMAAQPLVRYSYENPVETYATNVMGTVNLLESVHQTPGVKAVVNITTDKCYENNESGRNYIETDPMGGYDIYSNSKGCAELVTSGYRSSFFGAETYKTHGVALASVRAGNVIGGGDWAKDRLIPDILNSFAAGKPVVIRNPKAIRPWQHVLEPLRGYLTLAQKLHNDGMAYAEGWNFGPKDEDAQPVEWIVNEMGRLWGEGASWELDKGQNPHEAMTLKLDITKAGQRLGWTPALRLSDALKLIVEWTRQMKKGQDMKQVTLDQIKAYQSLSAK